MGQTALPGFAHGTRSLDFSQGFEFPRWRWNLVGQKAERVRILIRSRHPNLDTLVKNSVEITCGCYIDSRTCLAIEDNVF
jgi:hypothetical protein